MRWWRSRFDIGTGLKYSPEAGNLKHPLVRSKKNYTNVSNSFINKEMITAKPLLLNLFTMRFVGFLLFFASCQGLSRSDSEYITLRIQTHNALARERYAEALHNETDMLIYIYGKEGKAARQMDLARWKDRWNVPYQAGDDTALTVDRFLDYCNTHRLNPRKYIDDIDIRYLQP